MAKTLGGMIRFFSAWSCLDCFQRGFCDITSIKCNSVTSKIFQKCLIIVPKVWEVTHNVFHHPWHIYQMDFYHFFSSTKDFTFDFSMSHCYTRYRSEEISPNIGTLGGGYRGHCGASLDIRWRYIALDCPIGIGIFISQSHIRDTPPPPFTDGFR